MTVAARDRSAARLTSNPYAALGAVCIALMVVILDNSILNIALPQLSRDLDAKTSDLQWIIDSYTLVYACLMLTAGSLGDRFGRRRSVFWGVIFFGLTSGLAAAATSSATLIAYRAFMGASAAFMTPASLSIVANLFTDPRERARAIGIWASVASLGSALGPVTGGILLQHFWWGSVFLVNVPIAAGLAVAIPLLVPETKDPNPSKVDPLGGMLSIVSLSALLWATIAGPDHGWTSSIVLWAYAIGFATLAAFVWWESRCANPMLDLGFFRIRSFSAATVSITAMVAAWVGTQFMLVQLLQSLLGYSSLAAGLRLVPFAIIGSLGGLIAVKLAQRFGRKRVIVSGLAIEGVGAAMFLTFQAGQGYTAALINFGVFSAGQSLVFSQCIAAAMEAVPKEKSGVASGANNTIRQSALAFGVAVSGSVLATSYRHGLAKRTEGLGIDAAVLRQADRSVASGVQAAQSLPGEAGTKLLDAVHASFVPAIHATMAVAVLICCIGVVVAGLWIPSDRPRG